MQDFLRNRSENAIRKEIRGIRDSYHHYWDLLAELLQNSRDAINRKRKSGFEGPFFIKMEIDAGSNTVSVFDNGVGIENARLHEMLAPGGGDKEGGAESSEIGEKGVGLTYAVFSGNKFSISSKTSSEPLLEGSVSNAQSWLNGQLGVPRPVFEPVELGGAGVEFVEHSDSYTGEKKVYPICSYTKIIVGNIVLEEGDESIFRLTAKQLKFLIRTRTAVGVTSALLGKEGELEFDFYLTLNLNGKEVTEKMQASYVAPHGLVKASDQIKLDEVIRAFVSKNDIAARKRFLKSKVVYATHKVELDGWAIDVYGVMFPENGAFKQLAFSKLGLVSELDEQTEGATLFQSGIFVGTKGMPTGMKIEPKAGGRYPAYYKRCFFFVESTNLKFDLGRKSLHYKYTKRLQAAVAELFSSFEEIAMYQGDGKITPAPGEKSATERKIEIQEEWDVVKRYADLNEPSIPYLKIPNNQEAAVAAIFHELLGAKVLRGYHTLKTGYGSRYDAHVLYTKSQGSQFHAIMEFKHDLDSLIRDLEEDKKFYLEIDLIVAWDANEQRLKESGFELEAVSHGTFDGVTHKVVVPVAGVDPIEVILLRAYLDRRKSGR